MSRSDMYRMSRSFMTHLFLKEWLRMPEQASAQNSVSTVIQRKAFVNLRTAQRWRVHEVPKSQ